MTYVTSDIHGRECEFDKLLNKIGFRENDTLCILGDVIDRNPDGIKLLQRIMNAPNIKMLLGNHEYMMNNAVASNGILGNVNGDELSLWFQNGGDITLNELQKLDLGEQKKILDFTLNLPVNIEIGVGEMEFLLVHGSPENYYKNDCFFTNSKEYAVWNRLSKQDYSPDKTVIFGHTPTVWYSGIDNPMKIWHGNNIIGIDCGCAYGGVLGCLCLDNMKEFYSE